MDISRLNPLRISYAGIFVGAFASLIVSFFWYGPFFGETWATNSGLTKRSLRKNEAKKPTLLKRDFFNNIFTGFLIALFINFLQPASLEEVWIIVFLIWLGFILTTSLNGVLWEGEKASFYLINMGFTLISYLIIGTVYYLVENLDQIVLAVDQIELEQLNAVKVQPQEATIQVVLPTE